MPKIKFKNVPFRTRVRICSTPALRVCESCPFYTESVSENGVNCMLADNYDYTDTLLNLSEKDFPTNREWLESLSDDDLAAFYTLGIPLKDSSYISLYKVAMSFTSSQQGIKEWLSKPCIYLMEEE